MSRKLQQNGKLSVQNVDSDLIRAGDANIVYHQGFLVATVNGLRYPEKMFICTSSPKTSGTILSQFTVQNVREHEINLARNIGTLRVLI